ncbi:RagB/SusD family nutrient uptake outer membrane protein [Pontibacter sp. G13]|uniref:RagB/SusD family nutrient uptake outer membrane protein n=1 Tax=Pontibacter sp. G13 TaxID=3074898 RepID=UPI002889E832|nr:RagB/SusD family nutrient uptake outer membrane protein [Pontibacter sp. G13]WNJ17707.1 RagB/SusD family nutrient uptake outer membrane protein [Pontibacter sp. G13]
MNKKIYSFLGKCAAVAMISLAPMGCGPSYLDEANVFTNLSGDNFYQTAEHAQLAIDATYTPLQYQGLYRRLRYLLGFMSGDLDITSGGFQLAEYPGFNFNATSAELIPKAWEACYTGINRANVVLEKVPAISDALFEAGKKEQILAEAQFLRGFYYFQLVRMYGGVPIYEQPFDGDLDGAYFQPERNSEAEVYALIEQDFAAAAATLPTSYTGANIGRATAGAAQAFLGKAQLYQQKYAEASATLKQIIDGSFGSFELVAFQDNFTRGNENNAESLFEVQFVNNVGRGFTDRDGAQTAEGNWMSFALNPSRIRGFANGVPSVEVNDFFNQYPEEDTIRRKFTIARPGDVWGDWNPIAEDPIASGQWRDRTGERLDADGNPIILGVRKGCEGQLFNRFVDSPVNVRVMRYAEVLLLFAEAENEVNGPTADAYEAINEVRRRAAVSELPSGLNQDEFFERVVIERRLELTFEFQRWFDLVRWSRKSNVPAIADPAQMPGFVVGKHEYLPIPSTERIANPNLIQNPNY